MLTIKMNHILRFMLQINIIKNRPRTISCCHFLMIQTNEQFYAPCHNPCWNCTIWVSYATEEKKIKDGSLEMGKTDSYIKNIITQILEVKYSHVFSSCLQGSSYSNTCYQRQTVRKGQVLCQSHLYSIFVMCLSF